KSRQRWLFYAYDRLRKTVSASFKPSFASLPCSLFPILMSIFAVKGHLRALFGKRKILYYKGFPEQSTSVFMVCLHNS
ncbi:hypothetical protein HEO09_025365, partial [Escherichia coli]|nr:hypothetical protein [Escherichia coli]MBB8214860.1 hypothetical protein [Escherichia coli]